MNPCTDPLGLSVIATARPATPAPARREIDLSTTVASFEARAWHGIVRGTMPVLSGHIEVDGDGNPVAVAAELDLAGIDTGNRRRDKDLRGPRLLDTARHPVLRFSARDVVSSMGGWQVRGVLSRGEIECPVVMHVTRGGEHYDGFVGRVSTTRDELAVRAPRLLIRNRIELRVSTTLLP